MRRYRLLAFATSFLCSHPVAFGVLDWRALGYAKDPGGGKGGGKK